MPSVYVADDRVPEFPQKLNAGVDLFFRNPDFFGEIEFAEFDSVLGFEEVRVNFQGVGEERVTGHGRVGE